MKFSAGFLLFFGLLFARGVYACDFCMLGQGISPYLTSSGRGLTLDTTYIESDQVYDENHQIDSQGKKEAWLVYSLTGFYAFNEDWTGLITLPYAMKTNIDYDDTDKSNPGSLITGFGDVNLTARYTVFRKHELQSTLVVGAILGVKLPTGSTDNATPDGPADRHALPGTGSTDVTLGASAAYTMAQGYQLTGDVAYNIAGPGKWADRFHQYGNSLNFSLKGFYRFWPHEAGQSDRSFFVFTGPSGEWMGKEKGVQTDSGYDSGAINDSSGGTTFFWDLGVYSLLSPTTILNLDVSKGVFYNVNYSGAFDTDPAENYKVDVSLTFLY